MNKTNAIGTKKTREATPLVSVIMPVYNGSRFVAKAIESILAQTYDRTELLIVDDASTDDTWQIVSNYKKRYPKVIKAYRLQKNVGAFAAANSVIRKSRGQYLAPMDSDDIAHPTRLKKQVDYLQQHPMVILVGSFAKIIDANGKKTGEKRYATTHEGIYKQFALVNPIVHPSCMIRRSMLPQPDTLYYTNYGVNSDYYTLFSLLRYGRFANIPEYLLSYRIHGKNSSLTKLKEKFYTISEIRLSAVKNFQYAFPLTALPTILIQHMIVALTPETLLLPLYLGLRGMRPIHIRAVHMSLRLPSLLRYALLPSFLLIHRMIAYIRSVASV